MDHPRPLSGINPLASVLFDPGALLQRPELAMYPMTVIAHWADIDKTLAELLLLMLDSPDLSVGMAMFQALHSGEARRDALLAAAAEALKKRPDDHNLFRAVLKATNQSRNRRNQFAHHLWGVARELPDALLLVDPKDWISQSTAVEAYEAAQRAALVADTKRFFENMFEPRPSRFIDRRKIMVFSKLALEEDAKIASKASSYFTLLNFALDRRKFGDEKADQMRSSLLSAPEVRQNFRRFTIESMKPIRTQRRLQQTREKRSRMPKAQGKRGA